MVRDIANEAGVDLVDVYSPLVKGLKPGDILNHDCHFGGNGHQIVAGAVINNLKANGL
jgi:hypothetical protein